ncbi:MAG: hypothetical protein OFPII_41990 [Osedax symbiont Rs1]|nr:MAG: hypothetical protein OFPII_41990 [Osedax symbiont Rs1]
MQPDSNTAEQYPLAMMLCGGGHQYASLLGSYQAVLDRGRSPDLLIATCGGAIIANLICRLQNNTERLDWLSSTAMYRFYSSQHAGPGNQLLKMLPAALARKLSARASKNPPDLFNTWLFDFSEPFPTLPDLTDNAPDLLIIGSQLHYSAAQLTAPVPAPSTTQQLFSETVFSNARVAKLLHNQGAAMASHSPRIAKKLVIQQDICSLLAMRISVADCYYYAPVTLGAHVYAGGLINLFPSEIALRCAKSVIAQPKADFDTLLATPAIRHVFAFDPQRRLEQYHRCSQLDWLPEVAPKPELANLRKHFDWRTGQLQLQLDSYLEFKQQVYSQYQWGYQSTIAATERSS